VTPNPTAEVTAALEYLLALVKKRHAVLKPGDVPDASAAIQTVNAFTRGLKKTLDGPTIGQEDVILGCSKEPEPHPMRFHRLHAGAE